MEELNSARQTFMEESRELLREMEDALLRLERASDDAEAVNAVFRAAHTIKGSSGAFGFDAIVDFTHVMESVLEDVRAGATRVDGNLIGVLLACGDHLRALLDDVAASGAPSPDIAQSGRELLDQLASYQPVPAAKLPTPIAVVVSDDTVAPGEPLAEGGGAVTNDAWHVSLRFGRDTLRHGLEPLSFLRHLATMGDIVTANALFDAMPDAQEMDPESCYLGLEIGFRGAVDKETLEGAFEFLRDDCAIRILPPHSRIADYMRLIEELPEDKERLGELLVRVGVLTEHELEDGLRLQAAMADGSGAGEAARQRKLGEILVKQGVVHDEIVGAALEKQRVIKEHKALEGSFVRVRADKLDELITLVGELVIAGAGTRLLALRSADGEMIESTSTMERLVEEVRDGALKLRMIPIAETFGRFKRVARDLGRELGKEVELVLSGTETEVDKSMAERIGDPLMHLVRNALDHGIEPPQERARVGKPAAGRLFMNAYHDSGSIVIEVGDDGRGLDRDRILDRAVERGLVARDQVLDDAEILDLIMQPGFSTAEEVTDVSGRGVGMDVVRRNVEALRGAVTLQSSPGSGTTVSIRLPLTLAIIDGFLVGVGGSVYVIPLDAVVECMELSSEDRKALGARGYMNLRGEVLPLLRLRDAFGAEGEAGKRENVVVVSHAGRRAGFVVDALKGEFQTVIKSLGKLFERLSGVSGSTILGNGDVALILDVQELVQRAVGQEGRLHGRSGERQLVESE